MKSKNKLALERYGVLYEELRGKKRDAIDTLHAMEKIDMMERQR